MLTKHVGRVPCLQFELIAVTLVIAFPMLYLRK